MTFPLWVDAQFERAWAHFRMTDINGALAYKPMPHHFLKMHIIQRRVTESMDFFVVHQDADKEIDVFSEKCQSRGNLDIDGVIIPREIIWRAGRRQSLI